jgi:hypothetical protein
MMNETEKDSRQIVLLWLVELAEPSDTCSARHPVQGKVDGTWFPKARAPSHFFFVESNPQRAFSIAYHIGSGKIR